jgi:hypothetical protein
MLTLEKNAEIYNLSFYTFYIHTKSNYEKVLY